MKTGKPNCNRQLTIAKTKKNLFVLLQKKEFLIKERILNDGLDILKSVVYINYIKSESDVISYKFKLLTKISMLNFYLEYLVHKNIINKKIFNKLGRELNEISRLIYGWLKNEC